MMVTVMMMMMMMMMMMNILGNFIVCLTCFRNSLYTICMGWINQICMLIKTDDENDYNNHNAADSDVDNTYLE